MIPRVTDWSTIAAYFVANRLAALALLAHVLCVSVYTAPAAARAALAMRLESAPARWCAVPACRVAGECARARLPWGFAWELLGYSQTPHPAMLQISALTGVYGLSFLLAATAMAGAEMLAATAMAGAEMLAAVAQHHDVGKLARGGARRGSRRAHGGRRDRPTAWSNCGPLTRRLIAPSASP